MRPAAPGWRRRRENLSSVKPGRAGSEKRTEHRSGQSAQNRENAGFTPGEMRLSAWGSYVSSDSGLRFRISGQNLELPVQAAASTPYGETTHINARVVYENGTLELILDATSPPQP